MAILPPHLRSEVRGIRVDGSRGLLPATTLESALPLRRIIKGDLGKDKMMPMYIFIDKLQLNLDK